MFFNIPVKTTKNEIRIKEITNNNLFHILKFIETDDDVGLSEYFNNLVKELVVNYNNLNYIDKFLVLIGCRVNCIGTYLDVISKYEVQTSVNLKDFHEKIIDKLNNNKIIVKYQNFIVELDYPRDIIKDFDIYDCIKSINIDGNVIIIDKLKNNEKEELFNYLPMSLNIELSKKYNLHLPEPIKLFEFYYDPANTKFYYFDYKTESVLELLKFIFKDNLKNFFYQMYICSSKLNLPPSEFKKLTPGETKVLLDNYKKEVDRHNNANS